MDDITDPQESYHAPEDRVEELDLTSTTAAGLSDTFHSRKTALVQAQRALLEKAYISSSDEAYFGIKTHQEALKMWHREHTGWHIERRSELFRLLRQPSMLTQGYREGKQILQNARDCVYVLWILWYAANDQIVRRGNGQLFLLLQMLERLTEVWQVEEGCLDILMLIEPTSTVEQQVVMANRRSMGRALKYLQNLGCLQELDGQVDTWVERDEPVLYQFTPTIHLLIMSLDPDTFNAVLTHQKTSTPDTEAVLPAQKERLTALKRAWRALLLGPFFLRCDDPEAFVALIAQSHSVRNEIETTFGWSLEVNHDYACILRDPSSPPTTVMLNLRIGQDHVVLLLCAELRKQVADGTLQHDYYGRILISVSYLQDLLASVRNSFEPYWGKGLREKRDNELLQDVLPKMRQCGLLRGPNTKNEVLILPPAARFSPRYADPVGEKASPEPKRQGEEQIDLQQTDLWANHDEINKQ